MRSLGEKEGCFKVLKSENAGKKRPLSAKTLIMALKGKIWDCEVG